jgi:hypothetical protein
MAAIAQEPVGVVTALAKGVRNCGGLPANADVGKATSATTKRRLARAPAAALRRWPDSGRAKPSRMEDLVNAIQKERRKRGGERIGRLGVIDQHVAFAALGVDDEGQVAVGDH